jgi:AGZA family xanthine/uracil permease-like MFS transporter
MMAGVKDIHWDDLTEAIPAFLTVFLIPLGFSIAAGLSAGMVFYPFCKLAAGRAREVSIATWILGIIFLVRYVFTTIRFG